MRAIHKSLSKRQDVISRVRHPRHRKVEIHR
jgi:hypothetical protein